jgi:hypothetical protein
MRILSRLLKKRIGEDSGLFMDNFTFTSSARISTVYTMADVVNKMATDARIL